MFLDRARAVLLDDGYHGLTMNRIATATGYSRGTIYLHFNCKEEIILGLVLRAMERRRTMIERAVEFKGRTRERMQAIGQALDIFVRLNPEDMRLFYFGNAEAIRQKASAASVAAVRACLNKSMNMATAIVYEAIGAGDLTLPAGVSPEIVTFNLWAITETGHAPPSIWTPPGELGIQDSLAAVINGCEMLCDGYGWRPLSMEWDYVSTRRRICEEVFPEESRELGLL